MAHAHPHTHTHDHHHEGDTYYVDQLCLVALSGAFAGICLSLYFWQTPMLQLMLAQQFHPWVLASGVALLGLTLVRAVALWREAGQPTHDHSHHHDHNHGPSAHDHAHTHDHTHEHAHGHDHEHGWAPWRYVLLLLPVMLFLLGLPNKPPKLKETEIDLSPEARTYAAVLAVGNNPLDQLVLAAAAMSDAAPTEKAKEVGFKELEALGYESAERRQYWQGKPIWVVGQFIPHQGSDRVFSVARLRIGCCAPDAIQLSVPVISRESVAGLQPYDWVKVTSRVDFQPRPGGSGHTTWLRVSRRKDVERTNPDPNIYLQK